MERYLLRATMILMSWLAAVSLASAQTTVEYVHTDALGTPVAVTNSAGNVIERSVYEPYGQLINRPLTDGPGFTGHVQDAATGMTYMQQRYYDPQVGSFLSTDPVTAYSDPVAQFHRYRYANDNPYGFTDPDGRASCAASRIAQICASHGWGPIASTSFRSRMDHPNQTRNRLTHKPVEGVLNRRNLSTSTADGGYDPTGSKKLRSNGTRKHHGIDIKAEVGTPVVAAAGGRATNRFQRGYGQVVDIEHIGGLSTKYAHLGSSNVTNGQIVTGGDKIGEVGRSGNLGPLTEPHLHFEVRENGILRDPQDWFKYEYDQDQ